MHSMRLLAGAVALAAALVASVGVSPGTAAEPVDGVPANDELVTGDLGDVPLKTPIGALPNLTPNANITCAGAYFAFPTQGCTIFSAFFQAPTRSGALTTARVVAGPTTGPMRLVVLRAFRSQAGFPDQPAAPAGCCTIQAQSAIFTPAPNQATNLAVNLPMENRVVAIDGEPVEIVDYLGIAVLGPNISIPFHQLDSLDGVPLGVSGLGAVFPLGDSQPFGSFTRFGVPSVSGVVCPNSRSGRSAGVSIGVGGVIQNVCAGTPEHPATPVHQGRRVGRGRRSSSASPRRGSSTPAAARPPTAASPVAASSRAARRSSSTWPVGATCRRAPTPPC